MIPGGQYLHSTESTCAVCGRLVPARCYIADGAVFFEKHCPEHGVQRPRIYSDAGEYLALSRYHRAGSIPLQFATEYRGCPDSCGLCPQHEQHVCMPIVEITDHCDMACPICLVHTPGTFHLTPEEIERILDGLIASEGQIDVLNLSGGEPTASPHFRQIVQQCRSRKEILYTSVSTNGRRLLREPDLLRFLADLGVIVSLQFDGMDESAAVRLRGVRGSVLVEEKLRLIDLASEIDAPMSLTVTVAAGINEKEPARVVPLLFQRDNILSVMIQPAAYVGNGASLARPDRPLDIPDVIRGLDGAAGGRISRDDFSPLPCSHPACFSLAFYLRTEGGEFLPIKKLLDTDRYLDITQNRALFGTDPDSFALIQEAIYDLWSGPAALNPDSQKALAAVKRLLSSITCCGYSPARAAAVAQRSIKSIFIHHFMDRHNFDLSRARKCCQVYPQVDGTMVPACVYNCLRRSP